MKCKNKISKEKDEHLNEYLSDGDMKKAFPNMTPKVDHKSKFFKYKISGIKIKTPTYQKETHNLNIFNIQKPFMSKEIKKNTNTSKEKWAEA